MCLLWYRIADFVFLCKYCYTWANAKLYSSLYKYLSLFKVLSDIHYFQLKACWFMELHDSLPNYTPKKEYKISNLT